MRNPLLTSPKILVCIPLCHLCETTCKFLLEINIGRLLPLWWHLYTYFSSPWLPNHLAKFEAQLYQLCRPLSLNICVLPHPQPSWSEVVFPFSLLWILWLFILYYIYFKPFYYICSCHKLPQLMYIMWAGMNKIESKEEWQKTITTVPLDTCTGGRDSLNRTRNESIKGHRKLPARAPDWAECWKTRTRCYLKKGDMRVRKCSSQEIKAGAKHRGEREPCAFKECQVVCLCKNRVFRREVRQELKSYFWYCTKGLWTLALKSMIRKRRPVRIYCSNTGKKRWPPQMMTSSVSINIRHL